jgi:hypothetical protein
VSDDQVGETMRNFDPDPGELWIVGRESEQTAARGGDHLLHPTAPERQLVQLAPAVGVPDPHRAVITRRPDLAILLRAGRAEQ